MSSPVRPPVAIVVVLVACGALFGWLTSAVNHGLGGGGAAYASKVLGTSWGWLLAGLAATWPGRSWKDGFVRGLIFYAPAVVAYYANDLSAGVYDRLADSRGPAHADVETFVDVGGLTTDMLFYLVAGAAASALLAALSVGRRRGGVLAVVGLVALPAFIAIDAAHTYQMLLSTPVQADPISALVISIVKWVALAASGILLVYGIWRHVLHGPSSRRSREKGISGSGPAPGQA